MATKTITLELDAYEKLRAAKKHGESFSEVVRRAVFPEGPVTAADVMTRIRLGGSKVTEVYLQSVEQAIQHDPPPDNPWD
jgi:hypothetical protein